MHPALTPEALAELRSMLECDTNGRLTVAVYGDPADPGIEPLYGITPAKGMGDEVREAAANNSVRTSYYFDADEIVRAVEACRLSVSIALRETTKARAA